MQTCDKISSHIYALPTVMESAVLIAFQECLSYMPIAITASIFYQS